MINASLDPLVEIGAAGQEGRRSRRTIYVSKYSVTLPNTRYPKDEDLTDVVPSQRLVQNESSAEKHH